MNVRRWPVAAVALAIVWLFVRGVRFSVRNIAQELLIGLLFGLMIAGVFRRMFPGRIDLGRVIRVIPSAIRFVAVFIWDLITANIDVARRVLAPGMPIEPGVVEVPLRVETPVAITTIANSITLTPGTLTMDYNEDTNSLYVHAIDVSDIDSVVDPIRNWEEYALVIFDESRDPGDPVPDPDYELDAESFDNSRASSQTDSQADSQTSSQTGSQTDSKTNSKNDTMGEDQ